MSGEGAALKLLPSDSAHSFDLQRENINLKGDFNTQLRPRHHDLWVLSLHYFTSSCRIESLYVLIYQFKLFSKLHKVGLWWFS